MNAELDVQAPLGFNIKTFIRFLLVLLPIIGLIYNLRLNLAAGIYIWSGVYNAVFLGIILVVLFLTVPASKKVSPLRWYDYLLAGISAVLCAYYAFNFEYFTITGGAQITRVDLVFSVAAVAIILEAVRRTTGWAMVIVCLFFVIHANFAYLFPSIFYGPNLSFTRTFGAMAVSESGIFGFILGIASTYIIAFITFGSFLVALGAGERFSNLALAFAGRVRGGAAKIAVIGSVLIGTISGDPASNIGITGSFSIPLMKKTGFKPEFAAATETIASVGGIITPPMMGAIIFVMIQITGITLIDIMKAAIFPAFLYFLALYIQIDLYALKNKIGAVPAADLPDRKKSLIESWMFFVVLGALVLLIAVFLMDPINAVYYSTGIMILASLFDKNLRISFKKFFSALEGATTGIITTVPLIAAAGIILASVSMTGTTIRLTNRLLEISGGSLLILTVLSGVIIYVLGMGITAILSYILLANLVAPTMIEFGVPMIAAHFFIIYMGLTAAFTPPYALGVAVASPLAGSKFYATCFQAMKLGIVAFLVPISFVFDPVLLLEDASVGHFLIRFGIAIAAIYILSVGLQGFFLKRELLWWERPLWIIGGIFLFIPTQQLDLYGIVFSAAAIGLYFVNSRFWFSKSRSSKKEASLE